MPKGSLGNIQQILINMLKAQIHFLSFNTHIQVFIAPPSMALKTRELGDATVNKPQPIMPFGNLSRTLSCFSVGQPFLKQLLVYTSYEF